MTMYSILPKILLSLMLLLPFSPGYGQSDTLALVGGVPITVDDFNRRYELSVYPGKDAPARLDSTKLAFLYSLIAEKLLALAPAGVDASETRALAVLRQQTEETLLRDALFRRMVADRVIVRDTEIIEGLKVCSYRYLLDAFYVPDSIRGLLFYRNVHLAGSDRANSIAAANDISHDTIDVEYGDLTEPAERAVFGQLPGSVTRPALTEDGYVVFRILDRRPNPKYVNAGIGDRTALVQKAIRARRMELEGWNYLRSVMRRVKVDVNPTAFASVATEIRSMIRTHTRVGNEKHYHLTVAEIDSISAHLGGSLGVPMLRMPDTVLTLGATLDALPYLQFTADDTTDKDVRLGLHGAFRYLTQNLYLAQRARELGLQNDPSLQADVQMYVDAVRAAAVAGTLSEDVTVSPAERDSFYIAHRDAILNDVRLHLRSASVENIEEAVGLLQFLAGEHPRNPLPDTGRLVTRWVNASGLGELGAVLARLNPGQVYGPVRSGTGYSVFQVLQKVSPVSDTTLGQSIGLAEKLLLQEKRQEVLDRAIARLADAGGVTIHRARVLALNVSRTQMYTFRYIGFGGRINAVPMLFPRESWIRYSGRNVTVLP